MLSIILDPLIHLLYKGVGELLFNLMSNFVKKSVIVDDDEVCKLEIDNKMKNQVEETKMLFKACFVDICSYLQK